MSVTDHIPGMEAGNSGRNIVVGLLYLVLFPLVLLLLPFYAFLALGMNRNGIADVVTDSPLGGLPGLGDGGWKAGAAAFVYLIVALAVISAAAPASDSGGSASSPQSAAIDKPTPTVTPTPTATATPTSTPTPLPESDKQRAENALLKGFHNSDSQYRDGVREVGTLDGYNGRDGYLIELRYNLVVDGFGSLEDDAEHRAGQIAVSTLQAMASTNAENVTAVAIYAYVPTEGGDDTVSTKIVIDMGVIESIDWQSYTWQSLRDDADQYKFNSYLYA